MTSVAQAESGWIDVSLYQDAVSYVEIADFSGSPTFVLQTSPSRDDSYFRDLFSPRAAAAGVLLDISRFTTATAPVARWLRWKVAGTPTWRIVFRAWANVNPC